LERNDVNMQAEVKGLVDFVTKHAILLLCFNRSSKQSAAGSRLQLSKAKNKYMYRRSK
jgi:hypothetical protein